jgi:exopolysaccharide production protein ExoZ
MRIGSGTWPYLGAGGKGSPDNMKQAGQVETIISIQILRGIAATAVVIQHAAQDLDRFGITRGAFNDFALGGAGVDLFFIISGFVMVYASEPLFGSFSGASTFFFHRLIRIVPLYWSVTAFYLAITLLMPRLGGTMYPLTTIVASFLFVPFARPDGNMQPVLGQGWTLNYEMFFYAIFAVAVLVPRRTAVVLASTTIILAVIIGHFLALPAAAAYWTDPIVLEFALGMLLGLAYREGLKLRSSWCLVLLVGGCILFALSEHFGAAPRVLTWGVPAALVVAGATFGGLSFRNPLWHGVAIVGNASYALYLLHVFPLRALIPIAAWLSFRVSHWIWLYMTGAIVASALFAILVHYAFERPVTKALRRYAISIYRGHQLPTQIQTVPAEWKST